jgi:hypothetical protein
MIKSMQIIKWAEHVACMRKIRNAYRVLVIKPEGKRLLVTSRRKWEEITKLI